MHPAGRIYGSGGGNVTVSGIVTSADDKQPLIGVNVISGATSGVSTLADGTYRITVSAGTTLTFQYIGYTIPTFLMIAGTAFTLGYRNWKVMIPTALAVSICLYLAFTQLFNVRFPGIFF